MSDFKTRLIEERDQLEGRYVKLGAFLNTPPSLSTDHLYLLRAQYNAMGTYLCILNARIHALDAQSAGNSQGGSNPPGGPGTPP